MVKADRRISKRISGLWDAAARRDRRASLAENRQAYQPVSRKRNRPPRRRSHGHPGIEADNPIYHSAMAVLLAGQVMHRFCRGRYGQRQIMDHLMSAGPRCLAPVVLTNVCAGIIFAVQAAREMARFGTIGTLGGVFAAAYCRELAPLLTAGVLACQVGSAFAAEIAAMKLTQQIDALKMLRTDPVDYLVMPRVIACAIMLPILTTLALFCGVAGGGIISIQIYHLSVESFLDGVRAYLSVADVLLIMVKAVLFGGVIAITSCSRGLTAALHGRGVGQSATSAVILAWVALFSIDLVIASFGLFRLLH